MCSRCTPSSRAAPIFHRSSGCCAAGKSAACGSRISRVMPRSSMSHGSPAAASWRERWRDAPARWRCSRSGRSEGQAPWRRAATISTPSERLYRQMDAALAPRLSPGDQDREIASTVRRERGRLLAFIRASLADAAEAALAELPPEQREVFMAHEIEGVSFKELAARTGVGLNTLLSRKRYAVLYLQERLRAVWDEWLPGSEMGGLSTTNR